MTLVLSVLQSAIFMLIVYVSWDTFPLAAGVAPLLFFTLGVKLTADLGLTALYYFVARGLGAMDVVRVIVADILGVFLFAILMSAAAGTLLPSLLGIELDLGIQWAQITPEMALLLAGVSSLTATMMLWMTKTRRDN